MVYEVCYEGLRLTHLEYDFTQPSRVEISLFCLNLVQKWYKNNNDFF